MRQAEIVRMVLGNICYITFCDDLIDSILQLVDDVLNSAMEIETKISEAAESFERAINLTTGSKDSPSNDSFADRVSDDSVTKEMAGADKSEISAVVAADALKEDMYPKVGVYYFSTSSS